MLNSETGPQLPEARRELSALVKNVKELRAEKGPFCVEVDCGQDENPIIFTARDIKGPEDRNRKSTFIIVDPRSGYWSLSITDGRWIEVYPKGREDYTGHWMANSLIGLVQHAAINGENISGRIYFDPTKNMTIQIGDGSYHNTPDICALRKSSEEEIQRAIEASLAWAESVKNGDAFKEEQALSSVVREALSIEPI